MPLQVDVLPPRPTAEAQGGSEATLNRDHTRKEISGILGGRTAGFLVIMGPSEHGRGTAILQRESRDLAAFGKESGLLALHALHPNFGQRSDEEPQYDQVLHQLAEHGNIAMNLTTPEQAAQFGPLASLALGSPDILYALGEEPQLPIGIKIANLTEIHDIRENRESGAAPVIPIFSSGITDPKKWAKTYQEAHEETEGALIVDVANDRDLHGALSQIRRMEILDRNIRQGRAPMGIKMTATDAKPISSTDSSLRFALSQRYGKQLSDSLNARSSLRMV